MTKEDNFNVWRSRVDLHLQAMIKKGIDDIQVKYDFRKDFELNTKSIVTAGRVIRLVHTQTKVNDNA